MASFEQKLRAARRAYFSGNKHDAITLLVNALEHNPRSELAWRMLADCFDKPERKRYCYERILTFAPDSQAAKAGLAKLEAPTPVTPEPAPSTAVKEKFQNEKSTTAPPIPQAVNLLNLRSPDAGARLQTVVALQNVTTSSEQIVRELVRVSEEDLDWRVASAASAALAKPVHKNIDSTHVDQAARHFNRVERPGCVTVYVVLLILSACMTWFLLLGTVGVYISASGPRQAGEDYFNTLQTMPDMQVIQSMPAIKEQIGKTMIQISMGSLITSIAWNILIALGLWKMKAWVRWLLLTVNGLSALLVVAALSWIILLSMIGPIFSNQNSLIILLLILVGSLGISFIFIGWLISHNVWDKTWA